MKSGLPGSESGADVGGQLFSAGEGVVGYSYFAADVYDHFVDNGGQVDAQHGKDA